MKTTKSMIYIDIQYIQDVQEKNHNKSENAQPLNNKIIKQIQQVDPKILSVTLVNTLAKKSLPVP